MSEAAEFLTRPWGRLAYRRRGSGTPLVLLHSLALSGRMWDLLGDDLGPAHQLIAVDLRGHGESQWDGAPFSIGDMAADVVALLDDLGLAKVYLLGMSMGGTVAVEVAISAAERVDRLVLCDTTAWYGPDAPVAWEQRAATAARKPRELQVPFQTERWFGEGFRRSRPDQVAYLVGLFLRTAPDAHAAAARALGAYDGRAGLPGVTASTLVVTGEEDYATPPGMGRELAAGIPRARAQVWAGLRHFAIIESRALRQAVGRHLAGEPVPEPTPDPELCAASASGEPTA